MALLKAPVKLELLHQERGKYYHFAETKLKNEMRISLMYDSVDFNGYGVDIFSESLPDFDKELQNCYKAQDQYFTFDQRTKNRYSRVVYLSVSLKKDETITMRVTGFRNSDYDKKNFINVEVLQLKETRNILKTLQVIENFSLNNIVPEVIKFSRVKVESVKGYMFWFKLTSCLKNLSLELNYESTIKRIKFCKKIEYAENLQSVILRLQKIDRKRRRDDKWGSFALTATGSLISKSENLLSSTFVKCKKNMLMLSKRYNRCEVMYWINSLRKDNSVEKVEIRRVPDLKLSTVLLVSNKFEGPKIIPYS